MDETEVSPDELKGWYSFAVAVIFIHQAEAFSALGVAVFLPIILKSLAADNAFERTDHSIKCNTTVQYTCDVNLFGMYIDTSALILYTVSISVFLQFILFISLGSLADYGSHRKQFLIIFGLITAILGMLFAFILKSEWYWIGLILFILSNTLYGASFVFYYSWVPILTRLSPEAYNAREEKVPTDEYHKVTDKVANKISSKGFYYGYLSAVAQLILASGVVIALGSGNRWGLPAVYPMQITFAFVCLFQFIILLTHTNRLLKTRPGPPIPANTNYLAFSISNLWCTLRKAHKLPQLYKFLFGWFIYSDSFTTVVASAILFAQSELGAELPILLGSAILSPLFAALGNHVWNNIQQKYKISSKNILMSQCALYCLLPLWGLLGFFAPKGIFFGLNSKWEIPFLGMYHGFLVGATQSTCRVIFSELLPQGHESEFFSLYEITDKGSAWMGPLVVGAIASATGTIRWAFAFLLIVFILPIFVFQSLDIPAGREEAKQFVRNEKESAK